jgi:hypothetical protein
MWRQPPRLSAKRSEAASTRQHDFDFLNSPTLNPFLTSSYNLNSC